MKCYIVTFHCIEASLYSNHSGVKDIVHSFYAEDSSDLAEQIIEYEEELEEEYIVISKDIKEVNCK